MGCITSKAIARSMSIREEYFTSNFHSRAVALESLSTSQRINDNSKTSLPSKDLESEPFIITWDIIKDTEENGVQDLNFSKLTRSKSYQMPENTLDSTDKNVTGSRSFHTVEEYDALLARIHKGNEKSNESFEDYLSSLNVKKLQELKSPDEDHQAIITDIQRDDSLKDTAKDVGWKRKNIAKGLKSLEVCTVEFPAVARVRQQWVHVEGQVFSPGTYTTPKFGSYNRKVNSQVKEDGVEGFSPELIAAFEEYMKQLQVDEEGILSQMDNGDLEVDELS